ncbi:hypothetical protein L917_10456, partial [Phytophthora nicotianae]
MLRTFVFAVTQSLNWTVRMSSQSPMQMVSVERIQRNTETPMEVALTSTAPEMPPFDWPTTGADDVLFLARCVEIWTPFDQFLDDQILVSVN